MGDNVSVHSNDITNRRPNGDPDLAGTCIILGSSETIVAEASIKGNRIHRCGQMPRINREHGIYASRPRGAKITDNLIYDNADRGIQLYPNPKGTLVEGNVVEATARTSSLAAAETTQPQTTPYAITWSPTHRLDGTYPVTGTLPAR